MNKSIIIGRITKDPDVKTSNSGKSYINFSIAVSRKFKDANGNYQTDFIDCKAWNKTADFIGSYFKKGERICITGSIQTDSFKDKDGNDRKAVYINVEEVEFVETKQKESSSIPAPSVQGSTPKVQAAMDFFQAEAEASADLGQLPFEV